ncbi:putative ABC transport system permease protein [Catalinimonas alkaloidigena]|uniref:Putative ABC transport system permease protein n=2 Tax=Catalinimonas alkaloidigena TaxID=1075417 RepID=A0A1G9EJU7_9BACT|nr:putative ABC transport system permease protein [Catalinimonas alkaloidigena]
MAWRDSRKNRGRLALFMAAIVLGIAALVAINSFGYNLRRDIDRQARELLGADLMLDRNLAPDSALQHVVDSIVALAPEQKVAQEVSFASMVYFPKTEGTRLVQVRALSGEYPFYGDFETLPQIDFAAQRGALVDQTVMSQFGVAVGDSVRVGTVTLPIVARLQKAPDQSGITATVAPVVYIPGAELEEAGLVQRGSRVKYRYFFKLNATQLDIPVLADSLEAQLKVARVDVETVDDRKASLGRGFRDLTRFLNLVAFVALLLGCVGVGSAVFVYVREKLPSVAVMRCLGTPGNQAFLIYLIQIAGIGLLGAVVGSAIGSSVQSLLPKLLQDFLMFEVTSDVSGRAFAEGVLTGLLVSVLFALPPLLSIRRVSPLLALRASYEPAQNGRDPWLYGVYVLIGLFIFGFTWWQLRSWQEALSFSGAILLAFLLLAGVAYATIWLTRRFFPVGWSFVWRQGLASLFRPNNQTMTLLIAVGLGTALITTLYFTQQLLLSQVAFTGKAGRPNMVLFDIQPTQREAVAALTRANGLPVLQEVPIVTMRLAEINGRSREALLADTTADVSEGSLNREYRVTYRDSLISSETLTDGVWQGTAPAGVLPAISIEEGFARRMGVELGDTVTFDVQGRRVETQVGSFREIDWNRVQTNFLVVFPTGVLEAAPQFFVLLTRLPQAGNSPAAAVAAPAVEKAAAFQRALVQQFPNVSVVDLTLILDTLSDVLDKIAFVIRFMAGFSILTGLIVLTGSVLVSRFQRLGESVLLRTLGANRRQILRITVVEYLMLGLLASLSGVGLSLLASWGLAYFVFEVPFVPDFWPVLATSAVITLLTIAIGLSGNRGILRRPPLEVLRVQ